MKWNRMHLIRNIKLEARGIMTALPAFPVLLKHVIDMNILICAGAVIFGEIFFGIQRHLTLVLISYQNNLLRGLIYCTMNIEKAGLYKN